MEDGTNKNDMQIFLFIAFFACQARFICQIDLLKREKDGERSSMFFFISLQPFKKKRCAFCPKSSADGSSISHFSALQALALFFFVATEASNQPLFSIDGSVIKCFLSSRSIFHHKLSKNETHGELVQGWKKWIFLASQADLCGELQ